MVGFWKLLVGNTPPDHPLKAATVEIAKNEISKQGYHFVGNGQYSVGFLGPDDQKCPLLLRIVVGGSKKLFLGVLTKIKFFFAKN